MASSNRAAIYSKIHKVLKKHYKPFVPPADRSVLEHLVYACCLEDTHYEHAEQAFRSIQQSFFDWNEVRVTTITELGEVMHELPHPNVAATTLKRVLQSVFESCYSFDMEGLRKQNIGKSAKDLARYGATRFVVAYVTQNALGGHSIPVGKGELQALLITGAISQQEAEKGYVPGLERTISKKKGVEFGSFFHQLAADLIKSPFSPQVRGYFLEIDPDSKSRLPKRKVKRAPTKPAQVRSRKKTGQTAAKTAARKSEKKKAGPPAKKKPAKLVKKFKAAVGKVKKKKKVRSSRITKRKPR